MKKTALAVAATAALLVPARAHAQACTFDLDGNRWILTGNCTTTQSIVIPHGVTLDGNGFTVTATGNFKGGVVTNGGSEASVVNLTIAGSGIQNVCQAAAPVDNRLRGIFFNRASGTIAHNRVIDINKGNSGCQEGNAIEIRNLGTTLTQFVEIAHNQVSDYQKTGLAVIGLIQADIHHNKIGASATQRRLAANSIQVSNGAGAVIENNQVEGNSWRGPSAFAATAMLIQGAAPTIVRHNIVDGNSDVAIYLFSNNCLVDNNKLRDVGIDGLYDFGLGNWGIGNIVTNNKATGFDYPYDEAPLEGQGKNKVIPSPDKD